MQAESTFINIPVGMRIPGIIRTGGYTGTTTNAFVVGNQHHTAFGIMAGAGRAASYTRRVITMVAALGTYLNL
jgi:hypothetical protein